MRSLIRAVTAALALLLAVTAAPANAANQKTPRSFTGFGFDQCDTPPQSDMDAWLRTSKYWAVGIYIAGANRYCKEQANLTPDWVSTQLKSGWRLLPLTVGRQARCNTNYKGKPRISADPSNNYERARKQGRDQAVMTVEAAKALGIVKGSTLWYDLEHFDISKNRCRESALNFLSAWTRKLHGKGYVSGVYSGASTGIKMLDDARIERPGQFALPDQIWFARWNNRPKLTVKEFSNDGWMPHARVHQYAGNVSETHGGVTINIDRNYLDLGRGSVPGKEPRHCRHEKISFTTYQSLAKGDKGEQVRAAQCLLKQQGYFKHSVTGYFGRVTTKAVRQFRADHGFVAGPRLIRVVWAALLSQGSEPLLKYGAASESVRRLQRALNARVGAGLTVDGVFAGETMAAVKKYQDKLALPTNGVFVPELWTTLKNAG